MTEVMETIEPRANLKVVFSEHLEPLTHSLSILFIRNNASGRNKFREKWPKVAQYLFGSELITYDNEGTTDRAHRSKLEEEAGLRRIDLKRVIIEIQERSVKSGILDFDYVGSIIDKYGVDLGVFLYTENIINRVRPQMLAQFKEKQAEEMRVKEEAVRQEEDRIRSRAAEILGNASEMPQRPKVQSPDAPSAEYIVVPNEGSEIVIDDDRRQYEEEKFMLQSNQNASDVSALTSQENTNYSVAHDAVEQELSHNFVEEQDFVIKPIETFVPPEVQAQQSVSLPIEQNKTQDFVQTKNEASYQNDLYRESNLDIPDNRTMSQQVTMPSQARPGDNIFSEFMDVPRQPLNLQPEETKASGYEKGYLVSLFNGLR